MGVLAAGLAVAPARAGSVIQLTHVACQFVEAENGVNHHFKAASPEECRTINDESGEQRLRNARTMTLSPGLYTFRVTNKNVPYALGFWIRESDYDWRYLIHKLTKFSLHTEDVLDQGQTEEYEVDFKEGEYLFSGRKRSVTR